MRTIGSVNMPDDMVGSELSMTEAVGFVPRACLTMAMCRGQMWTFQISQEIMMQDVEKLNCGKVSRSCVLSNAYFAAAFLFRNNTA